VNQRISRRAALAAGALGTAALALRAAPVPKADDKTLIGKTVLPKFRDPLGALAVQPPGLPDGNIVAHALRAASWEVKGTKENRALVLENATAYLLDTDKLVPLSDAVAFFTQVIKDNPNDGYGNNFRGWAYYLLGKTDDALADFDAFLKVFAPGLDRAHRAVGLSNRGLVLAEAGKFEAAFKDLDEAVELGNKLARLNRGFAHELKGDFKKAVAEYEGLAESGDAEAANNLSWVRATCPDEKLRDGRAALKVMRELCMRTEDREGRYLDTYAAASAEIGDFVKAVRAQELALEDRGFARRYGDEATARLRLYKKEKPFRTEPPK
jgi:tetratricopeptide (TPR) repeat protein